MTSPLSIALSGLTAASTRANAAASNIANANTSGAREGTEGPQAYTPIDVVQISGEDGTTRAQTIERDPAYSSTYDPDSSYADQDGYVATPNVDLTEEIVDLRQAALAYSANLAVAKVASEMEKEMLNRFDETV